MIPILYEDNHILVVEKPINIPVQEDETKDKDLLSLLKDYIKEKYQKPGNVYLGLIHRLDRPVGGVMVFAKTSKAAARLSKQMQDQKFEKKYYAVVDGKIDEKGKFIDRLLKNKKLNKVSVDPRGKEAILLYERLDIKNNLSLVDVSLKTGRSHQIRVQFSHHGYPLYGDQKYNKNAKKHTQIALFSYTLSFYHPITKKKMIFSLDFPNREPFNLFFESIENQGKRQN